MHVAFWLYDPFFIDKAEIVRLHILEGLCKGINPEVVRLDRVPDCDMATSALVIVTIQSKPSNAGCGVKFAESSLVQWIREDGYANLFDRLNLGSTDRMSAVRERIEGSIADGFPELASPLVARQLVDGLCHGLDC